jgi:predicted SAM-dependent methyltransferase
MRLNLGCGPVTPGGWVNIDRDHYDGLQWRGDVVEGLPYPDHSADGAVANHVLQMVAWSELVSWLTEVRRVLQPFARLRILVPWLAVSFDAYRDNDRDWFPIDPLHEPSLDGAFCMYLTQAGATRSLFTEPWLIELCERAGFREAHRCEFRQTNGPPWLTWLDSRERESLIVEAVA